MKIRVPEFHAISNFHFQYQSRKLAYFGRQKSSIEQLIVSENGN